MKNGTFGLLLFDGTIFINKLYFSVYKDERDNFIIFFTLFHELCHALSRLLRGNDNFFSNTVEFTINTNRAEESGFYFERELLTSYLNPPVITTIEAGYLLNENNYTYESSTLFIGAFKSFREKNLKKIENLPKLNISKAGVGYLSGGCYCGGLRIRPNN